MLEILQPGAVITRLAGATPTTERKHLRIPIQGLTILEVTHAQPTPLRDLTPGVRRLPITEAERIELQRQVINNGLPPRAGILILHHPDRLHRIVLQAGVVPVEDLPEEVVSEAVEEGINSLFFSLLAPLPFFHFLTLTPIIFDSKFFRIV